MATRFFSIDDGFRLMVSNDNDHRMVCLNGKVNNAQARAARYFANGEIGAEEITRDEAETLALKVSGKPLASLDVKLSE